ncbi:MAG: WD40 repeat domain-containing protein, partial [Isosphaeraceae bacterium]
MPVFAPPEPATAPPYRKTFLRRHVEEQLRTRSVDVLALTEIERRLLDRFPDACHERLGRRGTPREGDAFRDWLRDGPLSLEAFFLGRDPISGGFPDLDVYRPVPVFDFGQHRSGDWPDLSTLLFELARQGDERGVVLRARGGAGKTVGQVKAFCDCAWGAERGVDPTKTLAGQRHVPCWLDPGDVPDRDTDLIEHMLLRQSNLEDRLDVETLKLWLKFDHPRPLLFCDLNAASEEGNPSDRLRLARGLVRYQKEHGRRGHRCVVAYRSARRDDAVLNQLGHLFRAVDLRPLGLDDAERYLRAFREFEARVVERVRKPPEQGGLGLPLPRSEHDIEAEVARLRELVRRYATAPVVSEDRDAAADDEAAPEALISTPLLMHFVSLLSGKELDGVKTITDLYRSVVERHVERDVTKYSTLQDCLELRETDSARPRLMAAMTRVALAIRQKGPGSTRLPHDELVDLLTHPGPRAKPREVAALTGNAEFWSSEASEYHWLEPMNSPESYRRALLDFSLLRSDGRSHGFLHDSLIDFFQGLAIRYHEGARRPLLVGEDWARAVVNRVAADPRGHRRGLEFLGGALGPEEARELLLEFALVHPVPADWPDLLRRLSGGAAGRSQVAHAIHEMMVRLGTTVCRLPDSMASQFHACLKDHPASPVVSFAASLADRLTASRRPWLRLRLGRVHSTHVVLEGHGARVNAVAALGDGRVVSGSEDGTVRVWNLSTGDATVLAGHGGSVRGVAAWGHHGVVSGSDDGTVRLWNLSTGDARVLKWPGDSVWGVAALGDGRVVSGLDDGTVRVWDPESEVVTVLRGHGRPVNALSVLTDGRVVSGSDDG